MITRMYFFVSTHHVLKSQISGVVDYESFWPACDVVFNKLMKEIDKTWPDSQFTIDVFNRLS
jgi:hypothetical protein